MHNGHKNTNTFRLGNVEVVLLPSKEEKAPKSFQEKGSNFLSLSKFKKESKESGIVYMLVAKEE